MKALSSHIILLSFTLVTFSPVEGQEIDLFVGPELNMANNIQVPEIFGHDETGYYAYSFDYREAVEFLDKQFRTVRRKHLDLNEGFKRRNLLGLFHFHDTLYMFTSQERFRSMELYVETIDKKTMVQNNDKRQVMEVHNASGWGSDFGFAMSRKEDRLLVYSKLDILSKNIQDLHFMMFGPGLSLEWEADQKIMYPQRPPRESLIKLSDEGDVYVISLQDDQGLHSLRNQTKNRYHLVAITDKGTHNNNYLINLPGLYLRGIQVEPGQNHDLSIVGFYSPTHYREMVDGIFYLELDNTNQVFRNQRYYELEAWFLEDAIAGIQKKQPAEMFSFRDRQLILRNNGDFIFLAENEYENQDYDTYQNIIAVSFSPGGKMNWQRVIRKRQSINASIHFNYSSYSVHAPWYTDKIWLVFNDDHKNGEWPPEKGIKSFHPNDKANLKVVGVGPSGELTSSIIYRKTRKRMKTPIPLQYYDMLDMQMVIPALRYKKYEYFRIRFSE